MGDIHVIFKKEDIKEELMVGKVAIVFDVLFATTTITAALADGASSVIPVYDVAHAEERAKNFSEPYILAGEDQGQVIEGFHHPLRTHLQPVVKGKHVILSTTNGTVALQRSSQADHLYASSLLNNPAMAAFLSERHENDTIMLVCSGSSGHYTLEDFYGAGSLIHYLQKQGDWNLSDAALTAWLFYKGNHLSEADLLCESRIGRILLKAGLNRKEIEFAASEGLFHTIPTYDPISGQLKEGDYESRKT